VRIFFGDDLNIQYNKHIAPYRKYMYRFAYRLCRNKYDAEDLTQQSLLKAYIYSQKNIIDPNKVKSFLSTTLYNTFLDNTRRKKNHEDLEFKCSDTSDGFTESYLESIKDPFSYDDLDNSIEINHYIEPVMEKLKKHPKLHQALEYYIQEYTYDEIAKLADTNIGNIKSRLYRARKFVSENISEEFLAKF
jgi:RNA polymerase sigma-70 factor (ECF subfamily)